MPEGPPICNDQGQTGQDAQPCDRPATLVVRCFDFHHLACRPHAEAFAAEEAPGDVTLHEFTYDPVANTVTWTEAWTERDASLAYPSHGRDCVFTVAVRLTTIDGRPFWALDSPWEW
jgi:hypothetical protein